MLVVAADVEVLDVRVRKLVINSLVVDSLKVQRSEMHWLGVPQTLLLQQVYSEESRSSKHLVPQGFRQGSHLQLVSAGLLNISVSLLVFNTRRRTWAHFPTTAFFARL